MTLAEPRLRVIHDDARLAASHLQSVCLEPQEMPLVVFPGAYHNRKVI